MRIGKAFVNVINDFKAIPQAPDIYGNQTLTVKIDPAFKDIICFLIQLSKNTLERPYHEITTDLSGDGPFAYRLKGDDYKITLRADEHFFRHGGDLKTFFEKLIPAVNELVTNLSQGWVRNENHYENPNIAGTYYAFLLQQLASHLGFNSPANKLEFDAWLPSSDWEYADKIYLYGDAKKAEKLIAAIKDELTLSAENINKKSNSQSIISGITTDGDLEITSTPRSVHVRVTNQPQGTTFIGEMSLNNQRMANLKAKGDINLSFSRTDGAPTNRK